MSQSFSSKNSYIIVTHFDEYIKSKIEAELQNFRRVWFNYEKILLDNITEIVEESYVSEDSHKYIILESKQFSNISQNSMLKLFEEPPKNISFIVIIPSKSMMLPTIRSRLPIKIINNRQTFNLNVPIPILDNSFSLQHLHKFLERIKSLDLKESKLVIETILKENRYLISLESDFHRFSIGHQLLGLNSNSSRVFLMLLLPFANRNRVSQG